MNIVSNLIFHCNHCVQIQHSSQFTKARQPRQVGLVVYLMQNLSLRRHPSPIISARIVRPINALQHCRTKKGPESVQSNDDNRLYTKYGQCGSCRSLHIQLCIHEEVSEVVTKAILLPSRRCQQSDTISD